MVLFFLQAKITIYGGGALGGGIVSRSAFSYFDPKNLQPSVGKIKSKGVSGGFFYGNGGISWIMSEGIIDLDGFIGSHFLNKNLYFSNGLFYGAQLSLLYPLTQKFSFGIVGGIEKQYIKSDLFENYFSAPDTYGTISGTGNIQPIIHGAAGIKIKYLFNPYVHINFMGQYVRSLSTKEDNLKIITEAPDTKNHVNSSVEKNRTSSLKQNFNHYRALIGVEFIKEIF